MVSPDVVVLSAASLEAASGGKQAEAGDKAQQAGSGQAIVVKGPTGARAFKRVNDEEWLGRKGAWDNSYEAKFGNSGWGAKASQTLLQVSHGRALSCVRPFLLLCIRTCNHGLWSLPCLSLSACISLLVPAGRL